MRSKLLIVISILQAVQVDNFLTGSMGSYELKRALLLLRCKPCIGFLAAICYRTLSALITLQAAINQAVV